MLFIDARELASELCFDLGQKTIEAAALGGVAVEHIFQPRLGSVGAVSLGDEDAHDRIGDVGGFVRA